MSKDIFLRIIFSFSALTISLWGQDLPSGETDLFSGSGQCVLCHLPGAPNTSALLDEHGNDISMVTYWRATMMANAAKDPLWQAKVKAEVNTHPELQGIIEDKCTTCHAPMGRTEAYYDGADQYTFAEMLSDSLAMDGVSCTVCHQIQEVQPLDGDSFSGHFTITDQRLIYGPYQNPVGTMMQNATNFTPVYSPHISRSELCGTCHTLFTPYVDAEGNILGEAPEQTTYLEWLNSNYPDNGVECQTCHVPRIDTPVIISNRPFSLASRSPFGKHEFVGGNQYMLKILKAFRTEIGVTASEAELDSVITRTKRQLTQNSVALTLDAYWHETGDLFSTVTVENLTGHKLPSGYPSRRMWLVFTLYDEAGDTVFTSGAWDDNFEIIGLDTDYEPHYDVITAEDQVQIYQPVPKDYQGNHTYTLLHIAGYLKDNRIPPEGYSSEGPAADSTAVIGLAAIDSNFNRNGPAEGTGADRVTYRISGLNASQLYRAEVKAVYQSVSTGFLNDLFTHSGIPEVDTFESYVNVVPNVPFVMDSVTADIIPLSIDPDETLPRSYLMVDCYPNPFNSATVIQFTLSEMSDVDITIYDIRGELVDRIRLNRQLAGTHKVRWDSRLQGKNLVSGLYLVKVSTETQAAATKILLLK